MPITSPYTLDPEAGGSNVRRASAPPPIAIVTEEPQSNKQQTYLVLTPPTTMTNVRKNSSPEVMIPPQVRNSSGGPGGGPGGPGGGVLHRTRSSCSSVSQDHIMMTLDMDLEADNNNDEDVWLNRDLEEPGSPLDLDLEHIREWLRCADCRRFLFPPINQCAKGHMLCRTCVVRRGKMCGKCGEKAVEAQARFAEAIAEQFTLSCSYSDKGCKEAITFKVR